MPTSFSLDPGDVVLVPASISVSMAPPPVGLGPDLARCDERGCVEAAAAHPRAQLRLRRPQRGAAPCQNLGFTGERDPRQSDDGGKGREGPPSSLSSGVTCSSLVAFLSPARLTAPSANPIDRTGRRWRQRSLSLDHHHRAGDNFAAEPLAPHAIKSDYCC